MPTLVPKCDQCPFLSIHTVGAKGPLDSPFVIVGESPGKEEMRQGIPFVGPSGKVLEEALSRLDHPEPYVTNAHKCMPIRAKGAKKEEDDTHRAVHACHQSFLHELQSRPQKPRIILATGAGALWATTGNHSLKITRERGRLFPSPLAEIGVVAAVHPAFLLRGHGSYRQFLADVNLAMRLVNGEPYVQPGTAEYIVVESPAHLQHVARLFKARPLIAADLETGDLSYLKEEILCAGFTYDGRTVYVVPEELIPHVGILFENKARFVWHNGKFDVKWLWHKGIYQARVDDDTMLQNYALDEKRGIHDLEQVAKDWLNSPNWKGVLDSYLPKKNSSYRLVPKPVLYKYMSYDIANTFWLHHILRPQIRKQPLAEKLYTRTLMPASKTLARVEMNGLSIDQAQVHANGADKLAECNKYEDELTELAIKLRGRGINPRSSVQLIEFLFDDLKIKTRFRSTDDDVLKELPQHPAIVALRKYRKPQKALSTYVVPYLKTFADGKPNPKCVIQPDDKVHTTYLIHGTPTGRLASREPNLQNIPREPLIRSQFVCLPGRIYVEIDLNQAELRSLACLSGDRVLCYIYETEGMSLHEVTRSSTFGNKDDWSQLDVARFLAQFNLTEATRYTPQGKDRILEEQKMRAKAVNFGIVYGRTAPSLAEEFHVTVTEGQRWIDAWFHTYPEAKLFIDVCRAAPAKGKDLVTVFGRRKRHGVVSDGILISLQNEAANFPHQSIASDINLHGAIELEERLREEFDTYIVNLVHDSILFDVPDDMVIARRVIKLAQETLAAIPPKWGLTRIPFKADPKIGYKWGALSEDKATELMKMAA